MQWKFTRNFYLAIAVYAASLLLLYGATLALFLFGGWNPFIRTTIHGFQSPERIFNFVPRKLYGEPSLFAYWVLVPLFSTLLTLAFLKIGRRFLGGRQGSHNPIKHWPGRED